MVSGPITWLVATGVTLILFVAVLAGWVRAQPRIRHFAVAGIASRTVEAIRRDVYPVQIVPADAVVSRKRGRNSPVP